ncbi:MULTISPECIES: hypothetical protein [unclassified Oceanispirochaeta]|uniref:hypothetical protein n=1 Tax=unclassified Oceanispirochaeta TaxID=2635722 RepID=UPI000E08F548|nr:MULTISPECIES: hypothetical protein [unclassified Oceanispirochaeta]MBF9016504.1 hypothetical protein [Oceanispirochaeta sp. M2]NPD72966.1 hypothetical protein [Oceanispirochaeta sp. M1]RDG31310.1 hypothetical protein DV872_12725 [Oceanispirochaeta sp. M1]
MKLQNRFLVPISILILAGMAALSFISYTNSKKEIQQAMEGYVEHVAELLVQALDDYLISAVEDIEIWSDRDVYREVFSDTVTNSSELASKALFDLRKKVPQFEIIAVADTLGRLIKLTIENDLNAENANHLSYRRIKEAKFYFFVLSKPQK